MTQPTGKPWFAPKRTGYGAGLPIAWEGWVALVAYLAVTLIAVRWLDGWERPAAIIVVSFAFAWVAWRKTDGGWRWRDGR